MYVCTYHMQNICQEMLPALNWHPFQLRLFLTLEQYVERSNYVGVYPFSVETPPKRELTINCVSFNFLSRLLYMKKKLLTVADQLTYMYVKCATVWQFLLG
jgi:hypothetical protein